MADNIVQSDKELTGAESALKDVRGNYDETYGFHYPENYTFKSQKGLNADIVRQISHLKNEYPRMLATRAIGMLRNRFPMTLTRNIASSSNTLHPLSESAGGGPVFNEPCRECGAAIPHTKEDGNPTLLGGDDVKGMRPQQQEGRPISDNRRVGNGQYRECRV